MKTIAENCWDNVVEWSFFLVPSDELVIVKRMQCVSVVGTICTKIQTCQTNLDDDGFIRHGRLRSRSPVNDLPWRKTCEQWILTIRNRC